MSSCDSELLTQRGASQIPGGNKAVSLKDFLFSKDKVERIMMETKLKRQKYQKGW